MAQTQAPLRIESWESLEKSISEDLQKLLDADQAPAKSYEELVGHWMSDLLSFDFEKRIYESQDAFLWQAMALQTARWDVSSFGLSCLAKADQPRNGLIALRVVLSDDTSDTLQQMYARGIAKDYHWQDSDLREAAAILYACSNPDNIYLSMKAFPSEYRIKLLNTMRMSHLDSAIVEAILLASIVNDADPSEQEKPALRTLAMKLKQLPGPPRWGFLMSFGKLGISLDRSEWVELLTSALSDPLAQNSRFFFIIILRNRDFIRENESAIETKLDEEHIKRLNTVLVLSSKMNEWQNPAASPPSQTK